MESNNKKAYKLWWEFLRLSDKYKKFYDFQMKLKTQWKSKPQKTHVHTIFFEWDSESYKFFIKEPVEVNLKKGVFPEGLIQTCFIFGNVHELSFEVFWKKI